MCGGYEDRRAIGFSMQLKFSHFNVIRKYKGSYVCLNVLSKVIIALNPSYARVFESGDVTALSDSEQQIQGKGAGKEALRLLLEEARKLGIAKCYYPVRLENSPSFLLISNFSSTYETAGTLRNYVIWVD